MVESIGKLLRPFRRNLRALAALFDPHWYLSTLPANTVIRDPFDHFLNQGGYLMGDPNPMFDVKWYLSQHPELVSASANPLRHYLEEGEAAGFCPSSDFDPKWYLETYPDVARARLSPLAHFLASGLAEGRAPKARNPFLKSVFDANWYLRGFDDQRPTIDPLNHYLYLRGHQAHDPNPMFDTQWYLEHHPELRKGRVSPLLHYLDIGEFDGTAPGPGFDPVWYLAAYPDVAAAGMSPLAHYLEHGIGGLRLPRRPEPDLAPVFDAEWYLSTFLGSKPTGDPLKHYLHQGGYLKHDPNPMFDTAWYLEQHPDVLERRISPLVHYVEEGEPNGAAPSPRFDPIWYLERYPDVASAGVSPLAHFLQHGLKEGRIAKRPRQIRSMVQLRGVLSGLPPALESEPCSIELPLGALVELAEKGAGARSVHHAAENSCQWIEVGPAYPRTGQVFEVEDAISVAGTRYLIGDNDEIIHDEDAFFHDESGAAIKYPGARRTPAPRRMEIKFGIRQGAWVEQGINVMHEYDSNYFHFIAETIPRMILAEEAGIPFDVPFLCAADLHPNIKELFSRVNRAGRPVIELERGTAYQVRRMYFPSDLSTVVDAYEGGPVTRKTGLDVARIRKGVDICCPRDDEESSQGRKIFAARGGKSRLMLNQQDVESGLSDLGFELVRADELDLDEQICVFRNASIVIGPTGAQMSNIVWCRPGTEVVILASDHHSHQLYFWELLGRVSGCRVTIVQGPRAYARTDFYSLHDDYTIDADEIFRIAQSKMKIKIQ